MIVDFILKHVIFFKQRLGEKHVLELCDFETCHRFESMIFFKQITQFGNKASFSHTVEFTK